MYLVSLFRYIKDSLISLGDEILIYAYANRPFVKYSYYAKGEIARFLQGRSMRLKTRRPSETVICFNIQGRSCSMIVHSRVARKLRSNWVERRM